MAQYAIKVLGYGAEQNTSVYELCSRALEADGLKRPASATFKSWVIENRAHIYASKFRDGSASELHSAVNSDEFLSSFEWRRLRWKALRHYGSKCMCCGATPATGAVITVDHIKPRRKYPLLALDFNNLQVLCLDCNHGKSNDDDDLRDSGDQPDA